MAGQEDRRRAIGAAGVEIVAEGGVRALTHRAVDRRLELPPGSTSFYARSRRSLIELVAVELGARARAEFAALQPDATPVTKQRLGEVAGGVAHFLDRMLALHEKDIVARYALVLEVREDDGLRGLLATATFSRPAAEELMRALDVVGPTAAAGDLLSLLEGLLLDHVVGRRRGSPRERRADLQMAVEQFLRGLPKSSPPVASQEPPQA